MTTRALLLCDGAPAPPGMSDPTLIRERIDWRRASANVNFRADNLDDTVLGVVDGRAADLIQIATCAFAADQAISRGGETDVYGTDWHRELHLAVPVRDPEFWASPDVSERLIDALTFATDDVWSFTFSRLADHVTNVPLFPGDRDAVGRPDSVVLFSGGADSLCATVELLASGRGRPLLVSHTSTPPVASRQGDLVHELQRRFPRQAPSRVNFWIHRRESDARDTSQRSRAFLFASLGAASAVQLGLQRVVYADNGVVSLNLPLNRSVVGAMASRSTHPGFLVKFNRLLAAVFDQPIRVENPLATRTRAETLEILKAHGCPELLQETISCSHMRGLPSMQRHCGACTQCIDRRFGSIAAGLDDHDLAERYRLDPFVTSLPEGEPRTIAVSYVRLANRLAQMTPDDMFVAIPELAAALDPYSPSIEADAREIALMLRRHGLAVGEVLARITREHAEDLGHGRLPATCLLRLAFASPSEHISKIDRMPDEPPTNLFRREGKLWRISFNGQEVIVSDAAGMVYLAHLLLSPGREATALSLLSLRSVRRTSRRPTAEDTAALRLEDHGAQDVSSEESREALRIRLQDLAAARTLAEQTGNEVELALIDKESAEIDAWRRRATGLHGKSRTFPDQRERARKSVSKAIDRALKTIAAVHRPLGRHLEAFVSTGSPCCYRPEPPVRWSS